MKYLTQISLYNDVKKIGLVQNKIGYLFKNCDLYLDNICIHHQVFNFVYLEEYLFFTSQETSDLKIVHKNVIKILKGEYYLVSLRKLNELIFIKNGYKPDGFHMNNKKISLKNFEEVFFIDFGKCISALFYKHNLKILTCSDINQIQLWQTDISHYGQKRYNHRNEEIDSSTPNTISGEVIGYEDTIVVPLSGLQTLALNINDGSLKWLKEMSASNFLKQYKDKLYYYFWGEIIEVHIQTGEIIRKLNLNDFLKKIDDSLFTNYISDGKMLLDFNNNYSNILVIDLETLTIESYIENEYRSKMLRVQTGDTLWHDHKVYARDMLTNTLYVYE